MNKTDLVAEWAEFCATNLTREELEVYFISDQLEEFQHDRIEEVISWIDEASPNWIDEQGIDRAALIAN